MYQKIKLTLIKSVIFNSVKSETFLRGQIMKAADGKLIAEVYHEQAGDEAYQESLLNRALLTNLEELKTHLSDYIASSGQSSADNLYSELAEDNIYIYLSVSERFNKSYTESLARLSSKFIEESMLVDWWKPINEKQSALYAQFVERDLTAIRRCFNKTAPVAPSVPYPSYISTVGTGVELEVGETATVTYTLSPNALDDIECLVTDCCIATARRSEQGFALTGRNSGYTTAKLYSRHNEQVCTLIHVLVTNQ